MREFKTWPQGQKKDGIEVEIIVCGENVD